jgi:signal transduction histidine kinase
MLASALLTFGALFPRIGWLQALALALVYTTLGAFMTAYIWSTRRATIAQEQEQNVMEELQVANERLELHARQREQLAAGRERQRLARELHDSVTQTIFSPKSRVSLKG